VRVLAPAERAYTYEYWGQVHGVGVPTNSGAETTYPAKLAYAGDYFYRIPDGERPWIAALDKNGCGLFQTSTARQIGRKLFVWGTEPGGRRWQDFLSTPGHPYFEIQAGLARTQMECIPMPSSAQWEWVEAYGLLEADSQKVHGSNWNIAVQEVAHQLERCIPRHSLEAYLCRSGESADRPPKRIVHRGSGWGALERLRRQESGERPFCSAELVFDDESLTEDQAPWLTLLHKKRFPNGDPHEAPGAWIVQEEWRSLLETSVKRPDGGHWLALLHLGVMHYGAGDSLAAEDAWRRSLRNCPSPWAYRNLAMLRSIQGRHNESLPFYRKAVEMLPGCKPLIVEFCGTLLAAREPAEAIAVLDKAPETIRKHGRLELLKARAGLAMGLSHHCLPILQQDFEVADIREGESSLTDFWCELRAFNERRRPGASTHNDHVSRNSIPAHLNFQVVPDLAVALPGQPGMQTPLSQQLESASSQSCSLI
jgi:hypothetical protein